MSQSKSLQKCITLTWHTAGFRRTRKPECLTVTGDNIRWRALKSSGYRTSTKVYTFFGGQCDVARLEEKVKIYGGTHRSLRKQGWCGQSSWSYVPMKREWNLKWLDTVYCNSMFHRRDSYWYRGRDSESVGKITSVSHNSSTGCSPTDHL